MNVFPCFQCGKCCQNVHLAPETQHLDRGDGTCLHYEDLTKLCSIYDQRPEICQVSEQYPHYQHLYSWDEYVQENLNICELLSSQ